MDDFTEQENLMEERRCVRLFEVGVGVYRVDASGHKQIYFSWPEATANFARKVSEAPAPGQWKRPACEIAPEEAALLAGLYSGIEN